MSADRLSKPDIKRQCILVQPQRVVDPDVGHVPGGGQSASRQPERRNNRLHMAHLYLKQASFVSPENKKKTADEVGDPSSRNLTLDPSMSDGDPSALNDRGLKGEATGRASVSKQLEGASRTRRPTTTISGDEPTKNTRDKRKDDHIS